MRPRPRLEDGFALAKLPVEYCEAPSADFAYNVSFLSMIHEPGHSKLLLDQNWLDALVDQMGRTLYAQCVTVFFVDSISCGHNTKQSRFCFRLCSYR